MPSATPNYQAAATLVQCEVPGCDWIAIFRVEWAEWKCCPPKCGERFLCADHIGPVLADIPEDEMPECYWVAFLAASVDYDDRWGWKSNAPPIG